ncbi:Transcription termination factor 4, mitochondrial [Merluccius polli]|uniref:Transcription termination factor 4, mitochondrial n=1 Tax=Merluccius polli TaxID=89951 RepID=A0AA47LZT4_MERPO|nr:Transcription termination factor 4, mitochondrial [Merluccius polli]
MNTPVAGCQVLRCSLRGLASLAFGAGQHGGCLVRRPVHASCRLVSSTDHSLKPSSSSFSTDHSLKPSSSTDHSLKPSSSSSTDHSLKPSQHDHGKSYPGQPVARELSVRSFLDMGFTDTQAELLHDTVSKAKGSAAAQQTLTSLTALFVLGLNPSSVLKVLEKCPELHHIKESQLTQRINHLRKLGLVEGSLQRVVAHYPQILTVPVKRVKTVVLFIREKCLFTVQQVAEIIRDSPAVVLEDLGQLEYKFQYVFFRMGVKQAEMVKSKLFRFPLEEVRCRHCFLERRGLYQTPDKKGQTLIENPKLSQILHTDRETYLVDIARGTAEEYDTFGKMMAREWQEEERRERDIGADSDDDYDDDDNEDEDDEQEEEVGGDKRAYTRKRKS